MTLHARLSWRQRSAFGLALIVGAWACGSSETTGDTPGSSSGSSGASSSGASGGSSGSSGGTSGSSGSSGSAADGGSSSGGNSNDSGSDSAAAIGCYDYGAFTPLASVTFTKDVMPLFAAKCASCHNNAASGTYYGSNAATVYSKLLNGTPVQAPQLKFVSPNDPARSYMLAKVEYANPGTTCSLVKCSLPGCELFAPPGKPLLESERAILRSWIMRGALNN